MEDVFKHDTQKLRVRAEELYSNYQLKNYRHIDRVWAWLLIAQWALAVFLAYFVSPKTWTGVSSQTHIHVYIAIGMGAIATLPVVVLAWKFAGHVLTRITIGMSSMIMAALFIHLTGGRIETHFFIFTMLAILSLYRDWQVLVVATVIIAVDHALRGIYWPESVFGVLTTNYWRIAEHAAYVIFEVAFLIKMCFDARKGVWTLAKRQAELEANNVQMNAILDTIKQEKARAEARQEEAESLSKMVQEQRHVLSESVAQMLIAMESFADGDLSVRLDTMDRGEIGRLFNGFNQAVANVERMFARVQRAVEITAITSDEISTSTERLAYVSAEQALHAKDVAKNLRHMIETIIQNEQAATSTSSVAINNGKAAREGKEIVVQTVKKIHQIADVVTTSADTVERLGVSSQKVGMIIAVIDEIAQQTNLLALNAAIEAARAGDQGRGFAVVADEVRKLAERTSGATAEITQMISEIQRETGIAVSSMKQGKEEVQLGLSLADKTGKALVEIVSGTQHMVDMISKITSASENQTAVSQDVGSRMQKISEVFVDASEGLGYIAGSTEKLKRVTEELRQLSGQFKILHEDAGNPIPKT